MAHAANADADGGDPDGSETLYNAEENITAAGSSMPTAARPEPASALVCAGKSGLLKLVRQPAGRTSWCFLDSVDRRLATKTEATPQLPAPPLQQRKQQLQQRKVEQQQQRPMEFEHDATYGQCVGTLRWSERDPFPALGAWPLEEDMPPALTGWRGYLEWRLPPDATGTIRVQPPMVDGLSYPLSLAFALQQLRMRPPRPGPLAVLVIGASSKAEERLLRDSDCAQAGASSLLPQPCAEKPCPCAACTCAPRSRVVLPTKGNPFPARSPAIESRSPLRPHPPPPPLPPSAPCRNVDWSEFGRFLPGVAIELVFVGPEIASASHMVLREVAPQLRARSFHGTLGELLRAEPHHHADNTIVVGFNTGFGNASSGMARGGFPLMMGWLPDLVTLLRLGMVAVFTWARGRARTRPDRPWLTGDSVPPPPAPHPSAVRALACGQVRQRLLGSAGRARNLADAPCAARPAAPAKSL